MTHDIFISHASEDKDTIARPLAKELISRGYRVWFDELELKVGASLSRTIDRGLAESRYGIVILSPNFFAKSWPERELSGLVSREVASGKVVILPIWHGVTHHDVAKFSPTLADKVALNSSQPVSALAIEIASVISAENIDSDDFTFSSEEILKVEKECRIDVISPSVVRVPTRKGGTLEVTAGVAFYASCPPHVIEIELQCRWDRERIAPFHLIRRYRPSVNKGSRQLRGVVGTDPLKRYGNQTLDVVAVLYLFNNDTGMNHNIKASDPKSIRLPL